MSLFIESLLVSAPKELDYLLKTYCKENGYMKLADLKQRHREYVFNFIRMIRRCLETQLWNINNPGIGVFTLFNRQLTLCTDYFRNVMNVESADALKESCQAFKEEYEAIAGEIRSAIMGRTWVLDNDLSTAGVNTSSWNILATRAAAQFTVKGHHLNILIPYPKEDVGYMLEGCLELVLQSLFPTDVREYYSFYTQNLSSRLFRTEHYLHTTKERTNMKSGSFDAVIVTHDNMFDDIRPRINSAVRCLKKDGTMILFGLTTDFKRLDLRRIASVLQDIQVYFCTTQNGRILQDRELCMVVGHNKDPQSPAEYTKLLEIFAEHSAEEGPFTFYGSAIDEYPLFAGYDISEAEAIALIPDMRNASHKLLATLLPKSVEDTRRPLLPFSAGQLGLVLISGDINGTIEEADTHCRHVVKGSSKQRKDLKTEVLSMDDENRPRRIQKTESVYASTNVNIVLPTGSFVELH